MGRGPGTQLLDRSVDTSTALRPVRARCDRRHFGRGLGIAGILIGDRRTGAPSTRPPSMVWETLVDPPREGERQRSSRRGRGLAESTPAVTLVPAPAHPIVL